MGPGRRGLPAVAADRARDRPPAGRGGGLSRARHDVPPAPPVRALRGALPSRTGAGRRGGCSARDRTGPRIPRRAGAGSRERRGAHALLSSALEDARRLAPQGDLVAELETRTGLACLHLDRAEEAEEHLMRGAALADRLGDRVERAFAERALARLDAVRGDAMAMG